MKANKIYQALMLILLTTSCMGETALEGKLIETESLIDNKQFIKESKERSDNVIKYGPDADSLKYKEQPENRTFVDKEETKDYVTMHDDGSGNVFNIDMNVENVDIRTFTQMLSRITGINFLVSDEVKGYVTAKLQDVSWPDALDSVLKLKALAKHVDSQANIIRIHNQDTIVQLETFERQRKEDLQRTMLLDRASEPLYTEIFKLYYRKPDNIKSILESVMGNGTEGAAGGQSTGVRNTNPQITIDERMNQLIVKARKEDLDIIDKLIKKVDSRTKQVFIEAFIVEVTDDFEKALGTRLGADLSSSNNDAEKGNEKTFNSRVTGLGGTASDTLTAGTSDASLTNFALDGATSGIGLLAGLGDAADLKFELTAMEEEGLSKVISNPRIFTLDNQEAIIFQGDEIPYQTVSDSGTQIQFKEAGLRLAVTPSVVGDGNLIMAIKVNKDTADTSQANPPITKSEITTNLVTKDGSIVVIGGIYTQIKSSSASKTPGLGDIPGAGKLFRRDTRQDDKNELMIFIAPRVI